MDTVALSIVKPPCTDGLIPAKTFSGNIDRQTQLLYDKLIDSLSMRSFVPSAGWSGHDHFFAVFDRIDAVKDHTGEWVDDVASRAAAQNQQYLELMVTPPFSHAVGIASEIGWSPELAQADPRAFAQFRQQMLDKGLRDEVAADREAGARRGSPAQTTGALRHPAGRARLSGRGSLHLAGAARFSARAGFRASLAGL